MYSSNSAHENSANNDTLHIRSSDRKKKKISVFICKAQVEYKSSGIGHSPIIELILSNDGQTKLVNLNIRKLDASNKNEKRLTVVIYWILISFGTRFYVWENQCTVEIVEQKEAFINNYLNQWVPKNNINFNTSTQLWSTQWKSSLHLSNCGYPQTHGNDSQILRHIQ